MKFKSFKEAHDALDAETLNKLTNDLSEILLMGITAEGVKTGLTIQMSPRFFTRFTGRTYTPPHELPSYMLYTVNGQHDVPVTVVKNPAHSLTPKDDFLVVWYEDEDGQTVTHQWPSSEFDSYKAMKARDDAKRLQGISKAARAVIDNFYNGDFIIEGDGAEVFLTSLDTLKNELK